MIRDLPYPVVLASASPRRREILSRLVPEFSVDPPDIDEDAFVTPVPWETARQLATLKARVVAANHPNSIVIAGDTVVAIPQRGGYQQLFKPGNKWEAIAMLRSLSGIEHLVLTGVSIVWPEGSRSFEITTGVNFRRLSEKEIADYVATGEPMDKAGSYAAQGKAAGFITRVRGSLTNVIGLPEDEVREVLESLRPAPIRS